MYIENPEIEVPDMFVNFLHPDLYDKYVKLKGSEADQNPELKGLRCAHIFEKRFRPHIYTEFCGVIFAIPITSTRRARHHVQIFSGRDKPSYLSFSCAVPIPPQYVPKESVIDILAADTKRVSDDYSSSPIRIFDTEDMNNRRAEQYNAITSYVISHHSDIQRNLVRFLLDFAKETNLTKDARILIRANSTLRYFEKDEKVKKALEYAYYIHYLTYPNKKEMVKSLTKVDIKQFADKLKSKKQYDKAVLAKQEEINLTPDASKNNSNIKK